MSDLLFHWHHNLVRMPLPLLHWRVLSPSIRTLHLEPIIAYRSRAVPPAMSYSRELPSAAAICLLPFRLFPLFPRGFLYICGRKRRFPLKQALSGSTPTRFRKTYRDASV